MEYQLALLTEAMVAQRLHCEVKTLQAWRCRGGGPKFIRVGRLVRYAPEDLATYIESRRVGSTSQTIPDAAART